MQRAPDTCALASVAETAFHTLLQSNTRAQFDNAFDGLVAARATITMNNQSITRERYREHLWHDQMRGRGAAAIKFKQVAEVPAPQNPTVPGGNVGVFYEVQAVEPKGSKITVSFNFTFQLVETSHSKGAVPVILAINQVSYQTR